MNCRSDSDIFRSFVSVMDAGLLALRHRVPAIFTRQSGMTAHGIVSGAIFQPQP